MDVPSGSGSGSGVERAHLALAHHELCTALTVLGCNVELVRIELRDGPLVEHRILVSAHLDELENAVDRLRDMAHQMKRWHDGITP